jgi:AbrB family looped-hinge helix DNA binding protein
MRRVDAMTKKQGARVNCGERCCYQIAAVISVDGRGQTVLPKDVREKLGISAGDKMAVIIHESCGKPFCLSMVKADELSKMVNGPLRMVLRDGERQ